MHHHKEGGLFCLCLCMCVLTWGRDSDRRVYPPWWLWANRNWGASQSRVGQIGQNSGERKWDKKKNIWKCLMESKRVSISQGGWRWIKLYRYLYLLSGRGLSRRGGGEALRSESDSDTGLRGRDAEEVGREVDQLGTIGEDWGLGRVDTPDRVLVKR